jgi:hypothetical protein
VFLPLRIFDADLLWLFVLAGSGLWVSLNLRVYVLESHISTCAFNSDSPGWGPRRSRARASGLWNVTVGVRGYTLCILMVRMLSSLNTYLAISANHAAQGLGSVLVLADGNAVY